jgi:hypothetical protein
MKWALYFRLGKLVYRILRDHFPQLAAVPVEDLLSVAGELLTTSASVADTKIQAEPALSAALPARRPEGATRRPQYRLVVRQRPPQDQ